MKKSTKTEDCPFFELLKGEKAKKYKESTRQEFWRCSLGYHLSDDEAQTLDRILEHRVWKRIDDMGIKCYFDNSGYCCFYDEEDDSVDIELLKDEEISKMVEENKKGKDSFGIEMSYYMEGGELRSRRTGRKISGGVADKIMRQEEWFLYDDMIIDDY